jgi:ferredoxin-NADP reductase
LKNSLLHFVLFVGLFQVVSLATVVGMREESKTVKSLTLKVEDKQFSFKAGQW